MCVGCIEEFHRELKQLTGVEACQCRKARIQRNHFACALLGAELAQSNRLPERQNRLPNQARNAVRLLDCTTQASLCSNDPCVSPVNAERTIPLAGGAPYPLSLD
jgi:hypothetical protein